MNGAEVLLNTLADNGVEVCFGNPGTSEMQLVTAFDRELRIRPVLCLFEGVATGAADGYARIRGRPAATLLHLGAGLANGSANLHNARRAFSPVVNIVGDHATYHRPLDAPLSSDIDSLARPVSVWVKAAQTAQEAADLAAEAVLHSRAGAGGPATLILPADCAWSTAGSRGQVVVVPARARPDTARVAAVARAVRAASKPMILVGSGALTEQGLLAAGRLGRAGLRVVMDTFVARQPRGAGRFMPERMQYFAELALSSLQGVDLMVLASTRRPVAFFAYPGVPNILVPEGCAVEMLSEPHEDGEYSLQALAEALDASPTPQSVPFKVSEITPTGALTAATAGTSIARHLPEGAIVSEDAVTSGLPVYAQTYAARQHEWLFLTGGAIGQGIPAAIGAALAEPRRKVVCLTGDGAGAYTLQGLWTLVREKLDVTVVVFANHAYRILAIELARTRSGEAGPRARGLLSLTDPTLDWVSMAVGFGMAATRCQTAESFDVTFARCVREAGPHLIEVLIE